jgi:ABC-type lipoprotein release transport system permease subunit
MVRVFDPAAYVGSMPVIVLSCALTASVPALRAVRVDPSTVLRNE